MSASRGLSYYEYQESQRIAAEDYGFYSLIAAAMRQADTNNMALLTAAFPKVAEDLQARYNAPRGELAGDRPPRIL